MTTMPSCIWSRLRKKCPSVRVIGTVTRNYKDNSLKNGRQKEAALKNILSDNYTKETVQQVKVQNKRMKL
jgi:hypothetical protein